MDDLSKNVNNVNTIICTGLNMHLMCTPKLRTYQCIITGAMGYAFKMFRVNSIVLLLLYMDV